MEVKKMNELQIFKSEEFGEVRTVTINNEPWFVGKDVTVALGYVDTKQAIRVNVADEDKKHLPKRAFGGCTSTTSEINNNGAIVINESGLYALIFGSRLESARRFKHWVTSEVLPAIRKHGGYMAGQENMSDDELLAKALMVAQSKIEENKKQIIPSAPVLRQEAEEAQKTHAAHPGLDLKIAVCLFHFNFPLKVIYLYLSVINISLFH